ncbi:MAG: apolipoprotein N-acyltransferase [Opitutales bacterium]
MAKEDATPPRKRRGLGNREPVRIRSLGEQLKDFSGLLWPVLAFLTALLAHTAAFPPYGMAEAAYLFLVPFVWWATQRPNYRTFLLVGLAAFWASWAVLISWLRHIAVLADAPAPGLSGTGLVLLVSGLLALFPVLFLGLLRWTVPRMLPRKAWFRIAAVLGLAGVWVMLEWIRTWFLFGFPWLPLAASQWERPVLLQVSGWTGAWGVSFVLVAMNLGIAAYFRQIVVVRKVRHWTQRLCPEFYAAMALLALTIGTYVKVLPTPEAQVDLFTAAPIQPSIPQELKWEVSAARETLSVLQRQTKLAAATLEPDLILWPEASTPLPLLGDPNLRTWVEAIAEETDTPLLVGSLAETVRPESPGEPAWYNGIFAVSPTAGLNTDFYAKRERVPYGEYVPFRWIPFIDKAVPLDHDVIAGASAEPMTVPIAGIAYRVGGLVCYEDIFPSLARKSAREGVDFFFVATNDSWYGREGMALQHAAHSVLRAVETRRPVLRAGNDGWSGWIDDHGIKRGVLADQTGSIHGRIFSSFQITRDRFLARAPSPYVRYGDWFVGLGALLGLVSVILLRGPEPPPEDPAPEPEEPRELPPFGRRFRRLRR